MGSTYERRIGDRVGIEAIPVLWRVPPPDQGRKGGRRARRKAQSGALLDVSVSGLQVRAPSSDDLSTGAVVHIDIDGVVGAVTIRRITPVQGRRFCDYGVEIRASSEDLARWVHTRLAASLRATEQDWSDR
ncbi:MAG TPA: PilZ domain-containing protein [Iamia sp.]|nr:PilZ domain-containing protein [Iamia sp.]